MDDDDIRVVPEAGGCLTYAVRGMPGGLPAVPPAALLVAWQAAHRHAAAGQAGPPRRLLFLREDGEATAIAIADRDARSWAEAVDRAADLGTRRGLALCLRLLALVEVMTRSTWLAGLFDVTAEGVDLHPALLRAAATMPLDAGARFDAAALRGLLSRSLPVRAPARAGAPAREPPESPLMPRPDRLLLLAALLALGACNSETGGVRGGVFGGFSGTPGRIEAPPPVPASERDARYLACRQQATRVVQYRERAQLMRTDETESSRGTIVVAPPERPGWDRDAAQIDRDRMIADCLRASEPPVRQATPAAAGGR